MSYDLEKTALSETGRAFVTPIIGGVAAAGVAYGLPAAIEKVREVRVRRNRDEYINAMKKVHDLKGIPQKDLHIAYNSIAMHSPHVLRDPLLGGQTLKSMANYRQADVNALNEINKLRGNNMMDQAILNATNAVAGGVTEGFKGYQAQRVADQDQAYRERMDAQRYAMDEDRLALERNKFQYTRGRDDIRDAYQRDRDAVNDARETVRDATKERHHVETRADRARDSATQRRQFRQTHADKASASATQQRQFEQTRADKLRDSRAQRRQAGLKHSEEVQRTKLLRQKDTREQQSHDRNMHTKPTGFKWGRRTKQHALRSGAQGKPMKLRTMKKKSYDEQFYSVFKLLRDRNI